MIQHTPTPWITNGKHIGPQVDTGIFAIAKVIEHRDKKANAHFIVIACNCHEELVSALERLYAVWRDQVDTPGELDSINRPIEEILAKAKGEQK